MAYDPAKPVFGPANSADVVLTFRNVHNWRKAGQAQGMFQGFFNVLKPGGVLGVVEHRAKADVADDDDTGYVGQQQVIAMAEAAGFKLDARSEVNANPRDTRTTRTACGRCRRPTSTTRPMMRSTRRSAKATA